MLRILAFAGLALGIVANDDKFVDEGGLLMRVVTKPEECRRRSKPGQFLMVEYSGWIDESSKTGEKGKLFDTNVGQRPFGFKLGTGKVIQGWDQGLMDMCEGEIRDLIVPPLFAYGDDGNEPFIPAGATLKFQIKLRKIMIDDSNDVFSFIDKDKSLTLDNAEVEKFFKDRGQEVPLELWTTEDKNNDGIISFDEFTGPKGLDEANPVKQVAGDDADISDENVINIDL